MGIDVLVPVLGRPGNAQKIVDSVKNGTDAETTILFLCSPQDSAEIAACHETGEQIHICDFEPGPGDYARKINRGYTLTHSEWLFLGADDLSFHRGWDVEALKVAEETGAHVIGTQDMGNPQVRMEVHSTHSLVRRSYIEDPGCTFDGPWPVLCELYDHQYCDFELCQTAMLRGVWAFSTHSRVEHLHPHWGKGEWDPTYEKSYRSPQEDHQLWNQRSRLLRIAL